MLSLATHAPGLDPLPLPRVIGSTPAPQREGPFELMSVPNAVVTQVLTSLLVEAGRPIPHDLLTGSIYIDYRRTELVRSFRTRPWAVKLTERAIRDAIDVIARDYPDVLRVKVSRGYPIVRIYAAPSPEWDTTIQTQHSRPDVTSAAVLKHLQADPDGRANQPLPVDEKVIRLAARRDHTSKTCSKCRASRPVAEFSRRVAGDPHSRLSSWCRTCKAAARRDARASTPPASVPEPTAPPVRRRELVQIGTAEHGTPRSVMRWIDAEGNVLPD